MTTYNHIATLAKTTALRGDYAEAARLWDEASRVEKARSSSDPIASAVSALEKVKRRTFHHKPSAGTPGEPGYVFRRAVREVPGPDTHTSLAEAFDRERFRYHHGDGVYGTPISLPPDPPTSGGPTVSGVVADAAARSQQVHGNDATPTTGRTFTDALREMRARGAAT